jgi:hypothetical protein
VRILPGSVLRSRRRSDGGSLAGRCCASPTTPAHGAAAGKPRQCSGGPRRGLSERSGASLRALLREVMTRADPGRPARSAQAGTGSGAPGPGCARRSAGARCRPARRPRSSRLLTRTRSRSPRPPPAYPARGSSRSRSWPTTRACRGSGVPIEPPGVDDRRAQRGRDHSAVPQGQPPPADPRRRRHRPAPGRAGLSHRVFATRHSSDGPHASELRSNHERGAL